MATTTDPKTEEALREARERAERAEARVAELEAAEREGASQPAEDGARHVEYDDPAQNGVEARGEAGSGEDGDAGGLDELRKDSMMAHLLDALEAGKDIGHYGRLVFAMVARHFLTDGEVVAWLRKDRDFTEEQAVAMLRQVEGRDYNPPKRERILAWQAEQEFPILPDAADPDCGNLYRSLKFPDSVYAHIGDYQGKKAEAGQD